MGVVGRRDAESDGDYMYVCDTEDTDDTAQVLSALDHEDNRRKDYEKGDTITAMQWNENTISFTRDGRIKRGKGRKDRRDNRG